MRSRVGRVTLLASATLLFGAFSAVPSAQGAVPKCFGHKATLVSNAATINGTNHTDVIVAGGKANKINGKGGADFICGGGGGDTINGGGGNDKINGGGGNDGTPFCLPGSTVFLSGGGGNDLVNGGAGNDCISGGAGNDSLLGGAGTGNDTINPGSGDDTVNGGDNGSALAFGGDVLSYSDSAAGVTVDLSKGTATGNGSDTIAGIEFLVGSQHDDSLTGDSSAVNVFLGLAGNDTIDAGGGLGDIAAYILATGPVTCDLSAGTATGEGNDTLKNINGCVGGALNDTITAAPPGSSVLAGLGGDDKITGGNGNDVVYGDGIPGVFTVGTDGNDTLDADGGSQDAGSGGGATDSCKNFEIDLTTGQPVGTTGRPADCES